MSLVVICWKMCVLYLIDHFAILVHIATFLFSTSVQVDK